MTAALRSLANLAQSTFSTKLALTLAITAFGDWFFYDHHVGISLAIFLIILAGSACLMSPTRDRRSLLIAAILLGAQLLRSFTRKGSLQNSASALYDIVYRTRW